jgi:hypothetical protein
VPLAGLDALWVVCPVGGAVAGLLRCRKMERIAGKLAAALLDKLEPCFFETHDQVRAGPELQCPQARGARANNTTVVWTAPGLVSLCDMTGHPPGVVCGCVTCVGLQPAPAAQAAAAGGGADGKGPGAGGGDADCVRARCAAAETLFALWAGVCLPTILQGRGAVFEVGAPTPLCAGG